jgi:hypothetical protein
VSGYLRRRGACTITTGLPRPTRTDNASRGKKAAAAQREPEPEPAVEDLEPPRHAPKHSPSHDAHHAERQGTGASHSEHDDAQPQESPSEGLEAAALPHVAKGTRATCSPGRWKVVWRGIPS